MPKYFEGELKLPYPKEQVVLEDISIKKINALLAKHGGILSLCVRFHGFERDCLGYIFNIKRSSDGFVISDITRKELLQLDSDAKLVAMIQHVSGTKYDSNWQKIFQRIRNQITSDK